MRLNKSMSKKVPIPQPLFDSIDLIDKTDGLAHGSNVEKSDYQQAINFLKAYRGSGATFNAYRREIERLLQWSSLIAKKALREIKRIDVESYLEFCQNPPISWIGTKKVTRFIEQSGKRIPNKNWRPFVATVSKIDYREGKTADPKIYELSQTALKEIFSILSSFYNSLIQDGYTEVNPIRQIKQKNRYIQKHQQDTQIRRLSELQWDYVIDTAKHMAEVESSHERTYFIMNALYSMYLRISELTATERWIPIMSHFYCDNDGNWWFKTVGKGNKGRTIAVSDEMLVALKRWRKHLGLPPLPSINDKTYLLPKNRGKGPLSSSNQVRIIVQKCFDLAIEKMEKEGLIEEAFSLHSATVHWLRHTGISEDVKHRPREHVRDDAGHSSSAITDKYIDIELRARHASAKKKTIKNI